MSEDETSLNIDKLYELINQQNAKMALLNGLEQCKTENYKRGYEQGRAYERKALMERPTYYAAFRPGAGWALDRDERGAYIPLRMVAEACTDENGYQQPVAVRLVELDKEE